jgi:hypothetical protein
MTRKKILSILIGLLILMSGSLLLVNQNSEKPRVIVLTDSNQFDVEGIIATTSVWRWRKAFQNDFAARMDWCINSYEEGPRTHGS